MHVRPIEAHELNAFARIQTDEAHIPSILQYLDLLISRDSVRVPWCYVLEHEGQLIGRAAFWKLSKTSQPSDFILLDLPWSQPDYAEAGHTLLASLLTTARELGVKALGHVIDSPAQAPQWQNFADQRHQLLTAEGFVLERETLRFEWRAGETPTPFPQGLTFRTLTDVGEDAFIDALSRVSASSLDQRVQHDRETMGAEGEARMTFEDLQQMEYEPAWWQLAYTTGGDLVGLVIPTKSPTFATIGYIGVVPEQRGHGYIHALLQQGMATLHAADAPFLRTDTDVSNAPMANAFRRAGYTEFATRREYGVKM